MTDDVMFEIDNEANINAGEGSMGLADFCNIDVSEIEANEGMEMLPAGTYHFVTKAIKVSAVTRRAKETNEEFQVPNVSMQFEIDEVINTVNYEGDEASLIGRKHNEFVALPTFDNEQFTRSVGRLKAFGNRINDHDKNHVYASVQAILADIADKGFTAKIKHGSYTNRQGEKVTTVDIDLKSIKAD